MINRLARWLSLTHGYRAVALVFALVAVGGSAWWFSQGYALLQERGTDAVWQLTGGRALEEERRLIIVDIDEASLAREGAWPWSRERLAVLSEVLQQAGARVQLFDIVFPEAREGDDRLAQRQQTTALHVGQLFSFKADAGRVGELSGGLASAACDPVLPVAGGYVGNTPALAQAAGHITPTLDHDGVVRRIAPLICHQHRAYPALGLQVFDGLAGPAHALADPRVVPGQGMLAPFAWLDYAQLGIRIPIDADGNTRIPFSRSHRDFISVSAADLLADRVPLGLFDGAIALVGATAFGLGDRVTTPASSATPGVEVHARMISAVLDQAFPHTPRLAPVFQTAGIVLAAAVLLWLAARGMRLHAYVLPLTGLVLALSIYTVHAIALLEFGLWIGWLGPAAFALVAGVALSAAEFAAARRERERLYRNLVSYLPRQVAEQLALREPVGVIEAERREVTILFADLRNASAYFESRPPEEVGALLHAFFTTAHSVVSSHGGVVEEFVGDSVMAVWDAGQDGVCVQTRALAAAHALVDAVERLLPETPPPGLEPLAVGVGLETGPALVGCFGAAARRTHAVVGETVTVAARVQAMSVELAAPVVVGEGFAHRFAQRYSADRLLDAGCFLLEGLQRPRHLFLPVAASAAGDPVNPDLHVIADMAENTPPSAQPRIRRVV